MKQNSTSTISKAIRLLLADLSKSEIRMLGEHLMGLLAPKPTVKRAPKPSPATARPAPVKAPEAPSEPPPHPLTGRPKTKEHRAAMVKGWKLRSARLAAAERLDAKISPVVPAPVSAPSARGQRGLKKSAQVRANMSAAQQKRAAANRAAKALKVG